MRSLWRNRRCVKSIDIFAVIAGLLIYMSTAFKTSPVFRLVCQPVCGEWRHGVSCLATCDRSIDNFVQRTVKTCLWILIAVFRVVSPTRFGYKRNKTRQLARVSDSIPTLWPQAHPPTNLLYRGSCLCTVFFLPFITLRSRNTQDNPSVSFNETIYFLTYFCVKHLQVVRFAVYE